MSQFREIFYPSRLKGDPKRLFTLPSLPSPPGIRTEMLKAHLPVKGDFLQSQIPSPRYRLQTSQDYRGSYFPWKSFHTMLGAKSGSRALPHLHLQGWELPSTSNSYYFGVSWTGPGSQNRRLGGNSYFYLFCHRFLPLERSFKVPSQGIAGIHRHP